jgi:hypothetical protein
MKTTKIKILVGVFLLAAVLLITGIAWAKATKSPIMGTLTVQISGPPEKYWEDDEGWGHYRSVPSVYVFTSGDLEGTGSSIVNVNFDLLTMDGDESGSAVINVTWGELSGTLEGRLSGTYTAGVSTGTAVYHGVSGDFEGMKLMMSYTTDFTTGPPGTPWPVTYQAIVLDPQGE